MNGIDNKGYTICPCCGEKVLHMKFCTECGASLSAVSEKASVTEQRKVNIFTPIGPNGEVLSTEQDDFSKTQQPVDDSNLTLLGEFCQRTVATVGGDGYNEIVLYANEADGTYQIHTYSKYVYMQKESHHSFKAKEGAYEALLRLVEELHLDEYEGKHGIGLCGGRYICKYRKDGVVHGVTTDNCGYDGPAIIMRVGNLLNSFKGEEITRQL